MRSRNLLKNVRITTNPDGSGIMSYRLTKEGERVFKSMASRSGKIYSTHYVRQYIFKTLQEAVALAK